MHDQHRKTPGSASQGIRADVSASAVTSEPQLAKPSWRWRLLLGMAIVCAVVGVAVAAVPELFLSAAQVTVPHLHP